MDACVLYMTFNVLSILLYPSQADGGCNIKLYFGVSHSFLVPCFDYSGAPTCLHWVEIKYKGNLTEVGPRYERVYCDYTLSRVWR